MAEISLGGEEITIRPDGTDRVVVRYGCAETVTGCGGRSTFVVVGRVTRIEPNKKLTILALENPRICDDYEVNTVLAREHELERGPSYLIDSAYQDGKNYIGERCLLVKVAEEQSALVLTIQCQTRDTSVRLFRTLTTETSQSKSFRLAPDEVLQVTIDRWHHILYGVKVNRHYGSLELTDVHLPKPPTLWDRLVGEDDAD